MASKQMLKTICKCRRIFSLSRFVFAFSRYTLSEPENFLSSSSWNSLVSEQSEKRKQNTFQLDVDAASAPIVSFYRNELS